MTILLEACKENESGHLYSLSLFYLFIFLFFKLNIVTFIFFSIYFYSLEANYFGEQ